MENSYIKNERERERERELNIRLIKIKDRIDELEKQSKKRSTEYKSLLDELQLYLDSKHDTWQTQKYIIKKCWETAYERWIDGGNLSNDPQLAETKFPFTKMILKKIIEKHVTSRNNALEIGCGNGHATNFLANFFTSIHGNDLNQNQIIENQAKNTLKNVTFSSKNIFTSHQKYDFIYLSDVLEYMNDEEVLDFFTKIISLLKDKNSIFLVRDGVMEIGHWYESSHWYQARYRNYKWYTEGEFAPYFITNYKDYAHSIRYLDRYFRVFGEEKRELIKQHPEKLGEIIEQWVNPENTCSYYYLYKKAE